MNRVRTPILASALALAAALTTSAQAHAGPTLAADLDLGTSVGQGVTVFVAEFMQ